LEAKSVQAAQAMPAVQSTATDSDRGRQRAVRTGWTNFSGKNIAAVNTMTRPRITHQGGPITRSARTTMFQHPGKPEKLLSPVFIRVSAK
jgi:hypothetical protein